MKFILIKNNGTTQLLNAKEVKERLKDYQIKEGMEAKQENPFEEVSYMTYDGRIIIEFY